MKCAHGQRVAHGLTPLETCLQYVCEKDWVVLLLRQSHYFRNIQFATSLYHVINIQIVFELHLKIYSTALAILCLFLIHCLMLSFVTIK